MVKVNWSGGKDSTCSAILHYEYGIPCFLVCYIPMFTESIPLIRKSHFEFLHYARDRFLEMGINVYFVHGTNYCDSCTKIIRKGKHKGLMQGYPFFKEGACHFKRDSKILSLQLAYVILSELQECLKLHRPGIYPLRNYKYFLGNESDQLSFFYKGVYWNG